MTIVVENGEKMKQEKKKNKNSSNVGLALVPHRNGKRLIPKQRKRKRQQPQHVGSFIPLPLSSSSSPSSSILGRHELLPCLYQACGCDGESDEQQQQQQTQHVPAYPTSNNETTTTTKATSMMSSQNKCFDCRTVNAWALHAVSRTLLRITRTTTSTTNMKSYNNKHDSSQQQTLEEEDEEGLLLQVRGKFTTLHLNSKPLLLSASGFDDGDGWSKDSYEIRRGTILSLQPRRGPGRLDFEVVSRSEILSEQQHNDALEEEESEEVNAADDEVGRIGEENADDDALSISLLDEDEEEQVPALKKRKTKHAEVTSPAATTIEGESTPGTLHLPEELSGPPRLNSSIFRVSLGDPSSSSCFSTPTKPNDDGDDASQQGTIPWSESRHYSFIEKTNEETITSIADVLESCPSLSAPSAAVPPSPPTTAPTSDTNETASARVLRRSTLLSSKSEPVIGDSSNNNSNRDNDTRCNTSSQPTSTTSLSLSQAPDKTTIPMLQPKSSNDQGMMPVPTKTSRQKQPAPAVAATTTNAVIKTTKRTSFQEARPPLPSKNELVRVVSNSNRDTATKPPASSQPTSSSMMALSLCPAAGNKPISPGLQLESAHEKRIPLPTKCQQQAHLPPSATTCTAIDNTERTTLPELRRTLLISSKSEPVVVDSNSKDILTRRHSTPPHSSSRMMASALKPIVPPPRTPDDQRPVTNRKQHQLPGQSNSCGSSFCIYICPLGQDLPKIRRQILHKKAECIGATVVDDYKTASYWIVSEMVPSLRAVADLFGLSESTLEKHLEGNSVQCVIPSWIASTAAGGKLEKPTYRQRWHGYTTPNHSKKKRESQEAARKERRKSIASIVSKKRDTHHPSNLELAAVFKQLGNLHQECPLLPFDTWKAYCFRVVAGRIQNLDFEITYDNLDSRVKHIKGIGTSCVDKIREYLETGTIARIKEFQTDPKRVAMKDMMEIWGIGRQKASELVLGGFTTIQDVYSGIEKKDIFFERNQLVGADCFEDFREEMKRSEVEEIGRLVKIHTARLYPGAEVTIMGSYRRGKQTCGDVDIHIVHKSYAKKIPREALGRIVDALWKSGHLAYHLTFIDGMTTGSSLQDFQESSYNIPNDAWEWSNSVTPSSRNKETGSSYMGVFRSPSVSGRRRRVDIKFYPYRDRIFASLYFTGNGFFNRSMRLWARRKFGYTLNDHGLFKSGTTERIIEASDEKDVFDKLGLVYKHPTKRDCFDAVEPIMNGTGDGSDETASLENIAEMTESEFHEDKRLHDWIK